MQPRVAKSDPGRRKSLQLDSTERSGRWRGEAQGCFKKNNKKNVDNLEGEDMLFLEYLRCQPPTFIFPSLSQQLLLGHQATPSPTPTSAHTPLLQEGKPAQCPPQTPAHAGANERVNVLRIMGDFCSCLSPNSLDGVQYACTD